MGRSTRDPGTKSDFSGLTTLEQPESMMISSDRPYGEDDIETLREQFEVEPTDPLEWSEFG